MEKLCIVYMYMPHETTERNKYTRHEQNKNRGHLSNKNAQRKYMRMAPISL